MRFLLEKNKLGSTAVTFLSICLGAVLVASPSFQSPILTNAANADPSLPVLYNLLMKFFNETAIDDFISKKNRTDSDAAQLLVDIDNYLRDSDAHNIVTSFWMDPEFVDAVYYLYLTGLTEIYNKINEVHQKYGYELIVPPVSAHRTNYIIESIEALGSPKAKGRALNITRRAPELIQEFLDFLELERVRLFFHQYYKTPALQDLYARFSDSEFGKHYREFRKLEELTRLGDSLVAAGFEIDSFKKIIEVCMTWENHTSVGLRHDLDSANRIEHTSL